MKIPSITFGNNIRKIENYRKDNKTKPNITKPNITKPNNAATLQSDVFERSASIIPIRILPDFESDEYKIIERSNKMA